MRDAVAAAGGSIDGIYFCPHAPEENCRCRKPAPGLVEQIAKDHGDVKGVALVGDSLRDLQCGLPLGCRPVLVRTGKGERTLEKGLPDELAGTPVFNSLADFVDHFLETTPS
jgi:D-glycero-D-manno-heptose 1,7-bisphosphate phosphatase